VERREDPLGWVAPAEARDDLGPGPVRGKVHAAEERVAAPHAGELVGALGRDEEVFPERRGDVLLRELLFPGEVRGAGLGVVLQERAANADLKGRVGKL